MDAGLGALNQVGGDYVVLADLVKDGDAIDFVNVTDKRNQYRYFIKYASNTKNTVAILYRNNESAIPFIYHLNKNEIPYQCKGMDTTFFTHPAVRDAKAIWEFAKDPMDAEKFMRVYYKLFMVRKEDAMIAARNTISKDKTILDSLLRNKRGSGKIEQRIKQVMTDLERLPKENAEKALYRIFTSLRQNTTNAEYEKYRILSAIAGDVRDLDVFYKRLDELKDIVAAGSSSRTAGIILSTIHASKGLEYDQVILVDSYDGILPAKDGDLEEERRLFYVAVTRAKSNLFIITPSYLQRYNSYEMPKPSRFLRDNYKLTKAIKKITVR